MRVFRLSIILAAILAAPLCAVTRAQDLLAPPPDLNLDELGELPRSLLRPNSGLGAGSQAITRGQAEAIGPGMVLDPLPDDRTFIYDPAEVWSSGSWLDRGYWYTVQDVVVTVREFDRRNVLLARDASTGRTLQIRTRHPGAVANARLTLGRFLFRDTENRDHLFETSFFGFGKELQNGRVTAAANALETPRGQFGFPGGGVDLALGNFAFDGSSAQAFRYTHEFESLEFNYRVRQRNDRDWMTLRPNGQWVRETPPTRLFEYLAGVRWMSADEWLNWDAEGARNGSMNIKANNDLVGVQLGLGASQTMGRWELNFRGVAGVYANFARVNRDFVIRDNNTVVVSDSVRAEEENISFLGEFQTVMRYHIHQNFSFRLGYQLMYLDSMAVAPFQITFTPGFEQVGLSGSSFYNGFLLGIDGYW